MYCGFTLCYLNVHFSWKFVNHLHYSILKQTYLVVTNLGLFISPYFFVYLYNVSLWVKILICFLNPQNLIHLIVVVSWRSRYKQVVASMMLTVFYFQSWRVSHSTSSAFSVYVRQTMMSICQLRLPLLSTV